MADSAPVSQRSRSSRSTGAVVLAAVLDVVLVLAFVLIGRGSHGENVIGGALVTFWPFAVGLVVGWLISLAWRRPTALWPTGVVVWASTLVIGMLLRVVSGQGIAVSFVIVAAIVLAVFLIGWRAVALLVTTLRRRRTAGAVPADGASR
ncbi:hypothetical protein GCM10027568_11390 [Humibacter soli]